MAATPHTPECASRHPFRPLHEGRLVFPDFDVQDVQPYIDWRLLYDEYGAEAGSDRAQQLHERATALLKHIAEQRLLKLQAVIGIYAVRPEGDSLLLTDTRGHTTRLSSCGALGSRLSPSGDYMGCYAVTAGIGRRELCAKYAIEEDDSSSELTAALSRLLTRAFAEALHTFVRREMWGYAADERLTPRQIADREYRGERIDIGTPSLPDPALRDALHRLLAVGLTTEMQLDAAHNPSPEESLYGVMLADRR